MNLEMFFIEDKIIHLNQYRFVVRYYHDIGKTEYDDRETYTTESGADAFEKGFVAKHQLLELLSKEKLDTSEYEWMEGIEIQTQDTAREIAEIASYGSLEAYQASLQETRDEYLLDLEYRVSMMELGLNE